MSNTLRSITLRIIPNPTNAPSRIIENIPWYPGITMFDAMLIADGMFEDTFTFTLTYISEYGAWLSSVDGQSNTATQYWQFNVDGVMADEGLSSFVFKKPSNGSPIMLDLVLTTYAGKNHPLA